MASSSPHSIADRLVGVHLASFAAADHGGVVAFNPVDAGGFESGISRRFEEFRICDERRVTSGRGWLDLGRVQARTQARGERASDEGTEGGGGMHES